MQIGLQITQFDWPGSSQNVVPLTFHPIDTMQDLLQAAEELTDGSIRIIHGERASIQFQ